VATADWVVALPLSAETKNRGAKLKKILPKTNKSDYPELYDFSVSDNEKELMGGGVWGKEQLNSEVLNGILHDEKMVRSGNLFSMERDLLYQLCLTCRSCRDLMSLASSSTAVRHNQTMKLAKPRRWIVTPPTSNMSLTTIRPTPWLAFARYKYT